MRDAALRLIGLACLSASSVGCSLIPTVAHQPSVHNPFPQLQKVAIAPFFNLSTEPSVDGRQFALAYFNELQLVPGFEVIPVGIIETTIKAYNLSLEKSEDEVRKLAQILGVDAVVIGAVTDYSPSIRRASPCRSNGMRPTRTFIRFRPAMDCRGARAKRNSFPAPLVQEAEMALARAQLKTQTPAYRTAPLPTDATASAAADAGARSAGAADDARGANCRRPTRAVQAGQRYNRFTTVQTNLELPANWPDPRGFIPPGPVRIRLNASPATSRC